MKNFKFLAVAMALLSSVVAPPSFSQTATLNYSTNAPVSCTHSGVIQIGTNGDVTIFCTTPVSNTGTGSTGPYVLTVNILGSGTVTASTGSLTCTSTTSASCPVSYPSGTPVTLTATTLNGSTFSTWTGCASTTPATSTTPSTCAVTMDATKPVTATFTGGTAPPPPPPGVVMLTLPAAGSTGSASIFAVLQGVTYAFALRDASGQISVSPEGGPPLMGTNAFWEVSLTQVPGDWATAKTLGATTNSKDGSVSTPYYASQGGQTGGMAYTSTNDGTGRTVISTGHWYFNLRVTNMSGSIYVQPSLGK